MQTTPLSYQRVLTQQTLSRSAVASGSNWCFWKISKTYRRHCQTKSISWKNRNLTPPPHFSHPKQKKRFCVPNERFNDIQSRQCKRELPLSKSTESDASATLRGFCPWLPQLIMTSKMSRSERCWNLCREKYCTSMMEWEKYLCSLSPWKH